MSFCVERNSLIRTSGAHPSPRSSRQREGSESPSAVRAVGHKSLGRQTFGERRGADGRVQAKPFGQS